MSRGDVLRRRLDVSALVVEEEIGTERAQELPFVEATEEKRFVDADVPGAQRPDHPLVRRRTARRDERRANRALILGVVRLDLVQRSQEFLERPAGKGVAGSVDFAFGEG